MAPPTACSSMKTVRLMAGTVEVSGCMRDAVKHSFTWRERNEEKCGRRDGPVGLVEIWNSLWRRALRRTKRCDATTGGRWARAKTAAYSDDWHTFTKASVPRSILGTNSKAAILSLEVHSA